MIDFIDFWAHISTKSVARRNLKLICRIDSNFILFESIKWPMNAALFIFSKIDIDRSEYWSKLVDASMTAFSKVCQIFDMYVVP